MTGRAGGHSKVATLQLRTVTALFATALLIAVIAACGGGYDPTPRPISETSRPTPTASATTGQATTGPQATQKTEAEPEPTSQGVLGRIGSQTTAEPEATGEPGSVTAQLTGDAYRDAARGDVKLVSVTAGPYHACGLTEDGEAICWGDNTDGIATPPEGDGIDEG